MNYDNNVNNYDSISASLLKMEQERMRRQEETFRRQQEERRQRDLAYGLAAIAPFPGGFLRPGR